MKINFDIQAAIGQQAGVGRYARELVRALARQGPDDLDLQVFYFDFKRKGLSFDVAPAAVRSVQWVPGRVVQKAWKTVHFPPYDWFAGRADLYHFPNFVRPPLTGGRSVVTIHDVSFLRMPETTEEKNLRYLTAEVGRTVRTADAIITDSAFSRREILELLKADPDRVHAVHLGLDAHAPHTSKAQIADVKQRHRLDKPYLLFVGTIEPRKNISFLVEVFERLTSFDGELVIAGMAGWKCENIFRRMENSSRAKDIRYLRYVPDGDLPALYAGAEALVYPSRYEGFGFPPLEAMAQGTPVVSSRGGSLPEVLGDAARFVDDFDAEAWAAAVTDILSDTDQRNTLIEKGRDQVKPYTWERTAQETLAVYRRVLHN